MGNLNNEPTGATTNQISPRYEQHSARSGCQGLQLTERNALYGQYALKEDSTIVKMYWIASEQEKSQLEDLFSSYRQINHRSVIQLLKVEKSQERGKHTFWVQFQNCSNNLAENINNKTEPYEQLQILNVIHQVLKALALFSKSKLPLNVLNPSKIGSKTGSNRQISITLDVLMNPEAYQSGELKSSNEQDVLFSLGMTVIVMAFRQEATFQNIQHYVFQLRDHFSYQLSRLVEKMLGRDPSKEASLNSVLQETKTMLLNHERGRIRTGEFPFKRGYNCLQSLSLFSQSTILPAARAKLAHKQQL